MSPRRRILLAAADPAGAEEVRRPLESGGCEVTLHPLREPLDGDAARTHLAVLWAAGSRSEAERFCRRLRQRDAEDYLPLLVVDEGSAPVRAAALRCGADAFLARPFTPEELMAHVHALARLRDHHDRLAGRAAETARVNRQLQETYRRIHLELELARRIQHSFLPARLPEVGGARFGVCFRPCGRVGGDFYDAFRLDEHHVGFYVADAMGHGIPASLLTIFLKRGVQPKEISGQEYRLVPPDEVLGRLNRDLLAQGLAESPFITMVYGLLDVRNGSLTFSRAGHPHPLHVPREGEPACWEIPGSLLGVFETDFQAETRRLARGDKLLVTTDGVDGLTFEGCRPGRESVRAAAERHRGLPAHEFVHRLAHDLEGSADQVDDLTLLALEFSSDAAPTAASPR